MTGIPPHRMLWLQFYGEIQPLRCSRLQSKFQFNCNWKLDCKQKFEMQPVDSVRCNSLCAVESSMELQLEDSVKRCLVNICPNVIPELTNQFRLWCRTYFTAGGISHSHKENHDTFLLHQVGEYPWVALLRLRTFEEHRFFCGGALVSER